MNQFPAEVSLYKFVVNPVSADSFMDKSGYRSLQRRIIRPIRTGIEQSVIETDLRGSEIFFGFV